MPQTTVRVNGALNVLLQWLDEPETRIEIQSAISAGIAHAEQSFLNDPAFRVPRSKDLRENGFYRWLRSYRSRIEEAIAEDLHSRIPSLTIRAARLAVATVLSQYAQSEFEERASRVYDALTKRAVRLLALSWTSRKLSDGLLAGEPEWDGFKWHVPLYAKNKQLTLGDLSLDRDGDVLDEIESKRETILAQL